MTLDAFNALSREAAQAELLRCCGSARWAAAVAARRPFATPADLLAAADAEWARADRAEILEAFRHHPRIGDVDSLRKKFASTAAWASGEQSGVSAADEATLRGLAAGNTDYERKFGYIFIVCATGKTAAEMLALLQARLPNDPARELPLAAEEQRKITRIRLEKMLGPT